jgi:predicted DCC family thiol-disulfide oxidoreductase YuxK
MATCSIPDAATQQPAKPRPRWLERLKAIYGLDVRSLAVFRVALAIMLLGDLWMRAQDLRAFYTDWGTLPRAALLGEFAHPWLISIHTAAGTWQVEALLFLAAAVFALMMLFGWRTRLATVLSWVMLTSLQNRNPIILQGGDTLLRMLLFWAMFMPLGLVRSVDAALDPESEGERPQRIFTIATVALIVQIACVYWSAFLYKTGPEWHSEGNAVWYALNLEQMATPFGHWMLHFPKALRFLTFFTLVVEAGAPFFLLFPLFSGPIRTVGVLFVAGLHLGFASCIYLGHFPFVAAVMITGMLPTWFWEQLHKRRRARRKSDAHLKLYYDGDCGFCRKMVLIIRELLLPRSAEILIAQDEPRARELMRKRDSWVVENAKGEMFTETRAMAEVFRHSFVLWPFAGLLLWKPLQAFFDVVYHAIERNRPTASRWTSFLAYRPLRWRSHAFTQIVVTLLLVQVIWWNVQNQKPRLAMPEWMQNVALAIRTDQYWDMFSPGPLRDDGWYVIEGLLKNGERVDLYRNGGPVSYDRIPYDKVAAQYPNERWRKYMMNLYFAKYSQFRLYYDRYLCRKWNEGRSMDDGHLLDQFQVFYMMHTTQPPGTPEQPHHKEFLANHYCWK